VRPFSVSLLPAERRRLAPLLPRGEGGPKGRMRVCLVFPERGRKSSRARPHDCVTPHCSRSEALPPLASQIGVSGLVGKAFRVLRTVSLDDQLSANAKKVDNVRSDRNLPAKLESAEATVAKKAPEAQFAVGRRAAHRSSAGALVRRDACVGLHRSSIGVAALIRRAFGAPPSPRGRRGPATEFGAPLLRDERRRSAPPSPSGRRWPAKPVG
jgi:hypothetical protein